MARLLFALLPVVGGLRTLQEPDFDMSQQEVYAWQAQAWAASFEADAIDYAKHLPFEPTDALAVQPELEMEEEPRTRPWFHFIMSTSAETLNPLKLRVVESVLYHHPRARVRIHAILKAEVPNFNNVLAPLQKEHDIAAVPFDLIGDCLVRLKADPSFAKLQTTIEDFTAQIPRYQRTGNWPAQSTDIARLCLLYHQGGMYLDTDALLVKPVPADMRNVMGEERTNEANGAIMYFEKGSSFMRDCLADIVQTFNFREYGANGPVLVTRVWHQKKRPEEELTVLPVAVFSPVWCARSKRIFWELPLSDWQSVDAAKLIEEKSVVVHFFFHAGVDYTKTETLGKQLMRKYCVLCKDIFALPSPAQTRSSW